MHFGSGFGAWTGGMGHHGRGHGRHGWSGPGSRRGGRQFDGGELRLVFLALIGDAPRHGYELIRQVEERTGGAYAPSPGIVYPTLALLAETGLIEEQATEGAKKKFAITAEGRVHLDEHRTAVDALMTRLADLDTRSEGGDAAPVRRAMANLGEVLNQRLARADVSHDALHAIADVIDEVARRIERMR